MSYSLENDWNDEEDPLLYRNNYRGLAIIDEWVVAHSSKNADVSRYRRRARRLRKKEAQATFEMLEQADREGPNGDYSY